jgi:hypothetical protein
MSAPDQRRRCRAEGCTKPRSKFDPLCSRYRRAVTRSRPHHPRCSVDGCERPVEGRRLCDKHIHRERRYGDPTHPLCRLHGPARGWSYGVVVYNRDFRWKGPARRHTCPSAQPARDWALIPGRRELVHPDTGLRYSASPADRVALCRACRILAAPEERRRRSLISQFSHAEVPAAPKRFANRAHFAHEADRFPDPSAE